MYSSFGRYLREAQQAPNMPELKPPMRLHEPPSYLVGLDAGMMHDPTAMAVMEKTTEQRGEKKANLYACRHLQRWLGVDYPQIAEHLRPMLAAMSKPVLVVDATGVGLAVVQIFQRAKLPVAKIVPITITAGHVVTPGKSGGFNVPKKELVSAAQSALQGKRLTIAPKLKEAATLKRELQNFRVKITITAQETFAGDWRTGQHDDLVLSACMAIWFGERQRTLPTGGIWW